MTDDWSSPTGEFELDPQHDAVDPGNPRRRPPSEEIESVFGITAGDLRMVDAYLHEVDLEAAKVAPPTPPETMMRLRAHFERLKAMTPEEQEAERERLRRLDR